MSNPLPIERLTRQLAAKLMQRRAIVASMIDRIKSLLGVDAPTPERHEGESLMPLAVVITRDVEARYRGFLSSAMLELAPGVYAHPRMSAGVRERIWAVLSEWHGRLRRGSIVMTWAEAAANGGLGLLTLGEPPKEIVSYDLLLLVRNHPAAQ